MAGIDLNEKKTANHNNPVVHWGGSDLDWFSPVGERPTSNRNSLDWIRVMILDLHQLALVHLWGLCCLVIPFDTTKNSIFDPGWWFQTYKFLVQTAYGLQNFSHFHVESSMDISSRQGRRESVGKLLGGGGLDMDNLVWGERANLQNVELVHHHRMDCSRLYWSILFFCCFNVSVF